MAAAPHRNYRPYLKVYVIWYPGLDRASITGKANSGKLLAERLSPSSDRFVADSKYRDVIPTRDQTPVIVQRAALGDDRKLVF